MQKKIICTMITTALVMSLFTGCGTKESESNTNTAKKDDYITVLVQGGSPAFEATQKTADAFKEQTGYEVRVESVPYTGVYDKLKADITASTGAYDVATIDILWMAEFAQGLLPIDDLMTDEVVNDLMPGMLAGGQIDDVNYGMPVWTNCKILMYRTDLFEDPDEMAAFKAEYGYELAPPTTWQDNRDVAKFFTRDTNGDGETDLYGTGIFGKTDGDTACCWLEESVQAGAKPVVLGDDGEVLVNQKPYVDALTFLSDIVNEDKSCPPGAMEMASGEVSEMFYQGNLAMMLNWGHFYLAANNPETSKVAGKVATAPHLSGSAGVGAIPGPWYQVIPESSKKQEIAKEYVKFMYDNNELIMQNLGTAARKSLFEEYGKKEGYEFLADIQATLEGPATQNRAPIVEWNLIETEALVPAIQQALLKEKTPQEALDDAAEMIKDLLN